jgi:acyl carrier protein
MTQDAIQDRLTPLFCDVFDRDDIVLRQEMTAKDIEGWDSFNHINLIVAIESSFGIKFHTSEIESLRDVGHLVELIERKLGAKPGETLSAASG